MGGNAVFGNVVHFPRTYLYFHGLSARADNRRMQRLVVVGLGHGNIVLEPVRQGLPQAVHDAENAVTVLNGVDNNANGIQIVDLAEIAVIFLHFFVNAVKMFGPAVDFKGNARFG